LAERSGGSSQTPRKLLAVRKATGVKLGNPSNICEAGQIGRTVLIRAADEHAKSMLPILRTLRAEGAITIGAIMRTLNERKIPRQRGSRWQVSSVASLLARAQKLEPCASSPL
jgi:hypothetical protein